MVDLHELEENHQDVRDLVSRYSDEELDIEQQIASLQELLRESKIQSIIERIALGLTLSGFSATLPIPDDGVGIPPRFGEYLLGLCIMSSQDGTKEPTYQEIAEAAARIQDAYLYSEMSDFDPNSVSEEERRRYDFQFHLRLREVTASRFLFWNQPIEAARRAYTPYDDKLKEHLGFTIRQAIHFTKYLEKVEDVAFKKVLRESDISLENIFSDQDTVRSIQNQIRDEGQIPKTTERNDFLRDVSALEEAYQASSSFIDTIWLSEDLLVNQLPNGYDEGSFLDFLGRMSIELGDPHDNWPFDFEQLDDPNPLHGHPLLKQEGDYLIAHPASLRRAIMDPFYYDLIELDEGTFGDTWGNYIEEWVYDSLTKVFPEDNVYLNPEYESSDGRKEATDVLVIYKQWIIVVECKSKKLVVETRSGNYDKAKHDLQDGIGNASSQANDFIQKVKENEITEIITPSRTVSLPDSQVDYLPTVALGEQYDSLGTMLFHEVIEPSGKLPFVVSVYDLQVVTEALSDPLELIKYWYQRTKVTESEKIFGQDEIDYLGTFIKNGYTFPQLEEDEFVILIDESHTVGKEIGYKYGP